MRNQPPALNPAHGLTHDPALARLLDQIATARHAGAALDIRGGNTKAFYGGVPQGEPLETRPLAGISSHEPTELVVTARAGTLLAELEAALAERGQCLPFEPPRFGRGGGEDDIERGGVRGVADRADRSDGNGDGDMAGAVGGMVAAGLAGPARAAVGSVRDYVLGATLLNGRGELLTFGGQVMKNVAGYDVARLLAGSMGVLGVICEVSLKVLPRVPAETTLGFELDEGEALAWLDARRAQPLPITASSWHAGRLHVRLGGARAAVVSAVQALGGAALEPDEASVWWDKLRDQRHPAFTPGAGESLWRLSLPLGTPALALPGAALVEWGGAQRWLRTTAPADAVRAIAAAAGGHATLFRGAEAARSAGAFAPLSAPLARIHRELKQAFDPAGVFNRGRLYPDL